MVNIAPPPPPPEPITTFTGRIRVSGRVVTVIARRWSEDVTGRCGYCPHHRCGFAHGACQVAVLQDVPPDDAPTFVRPADGLGGVR